jgi:hypothetical protein
MGSKLSKIPFDLEFNDNMCYICNGDIEFKKRIDSQGINHIESCGNCYSCLRKKGCGGYEKIIDIEVEIPICNNCNICLKCKENIFNINDEYSDHDFCKINNSYLHRECYKEYTKPNDDTKYYSFCGLTNKWELRGIYVICNICQNKYEQSMHDTKPTNMCKECKEKIEFNNKWNKTSPQEKLNIHGIIKLKKLAKNKNLKGYSKYKKSELINKLKPLVIESDFPIK